MSGVVFLDLETTGLDPQRHDIWEIGFIVRDDTGADTEWLYRVWPNMATADPGGLRVGRFYERTAKMQPYGEEDFYLAIDLARPNTWTVNVGERWSDPFTVARDLAHVLDGKHIVGAVPSFDAAFLNRWLPAHGQAATFHYHLIDIEALAVGYLYGSQEPAQIPLPWRSDDISRACGVEPPGKADRHTALGDARWVRDLYDALTGSAR